MLAFHDLGLLNGDNVILSLEILPKDSCKAPASAPDGRDEEACKAHEGILDVSQYIPDSQYYEDFKTAVYNRMPEMNYSMNAPNEVSILQKSQVCNIITLELWPMSRRFYCANVSVTS